MGENSKIEWTRTRGMLLFQARFALRKGGQEGRCMGSAIGCRKVAAAKAGMSLEDYIARVEAGQKWCTGHKEWHARDAFGADASRADGLAAQCLRWRKRHYDTTHVRKGMRSRAGLFRVPARDGDKKQARARANHAVDAGRLPDPNSLPCVDCGHKYDGQRRHEYDHHMGYSAEHQLTVQAVCSVCHRRRESERAMAENKLPANSKLSHEQVRAIRSSDQSTRALAESMGLDTETVRLVRVGATYRCVR